MTIQEAIRRAIIELKDENIEFPKLKSRLLMQFILNKPRQYVIVHDSEHLTLIEERKFFEAVAKVREGNPLEHITHQKEFMKLNFYVNENVLIPRQDTEILVEEVIKISQKTKVTKILDLCTGSGAIAVSLAKYIPNCQITAIDICNKALKVAEKNARNNQVQEKIKFIKSDIFDNLKSEKFDIIVSNPPYIRKDIIPKLESQVRKEPYIALEGGDDGLYFYRKIISRAFEFLTYCGFLCFEIGFDQKIDVIETIENEEKYDNIYSKKDLCGRDRIIVAQLKYEER